MKRFDLSGTLMNRDTELARFTIEDGFPTAFEALSPDPLAYPYEMERHPNGNTLINALLERVVPETRQGLLEDLQAVGIQSYDLTAILTHQNASSLHDPFWVRFADGPQTWRQLRDKLGFLS